MAAFSVYLIFNIVWSMAVLLEELGFWRYRVFYCGLGACNLPFLHRVVRMDYMLCPP